MSCSENCQCRPGVVALVFVPGIMGTRLKNRRSGDSVWDPAAGAGYQGPSGAAIEIREKRQQEMAEAQPEEDDGIIESMGKWFRRGWIKDKQQIDKVVEKGRTARRYAGVVPRVSDFAFAGPQKRKALLVNDEAKRKGKPVTDRKDDLLEVDEGTDKYFEVYTAVPPSQIAEKRKRGWGEVHWDSYGMLLKYLERKAHDTFEKEYPGLSFPVFAIGYNWMLSNQEAGKRIKERIADFRQQIVKDDPRGLSPSDVRFILISHSMGGYASRAGFAMEGLEGEIEAAIHGAMPTHGSPATYKKFRAGESGVPKLLIGKNPADITATLGFCQGGLELLPNQHYRTADNDDKWLYLKSGEEPEVVDIGYGDTVFDFYARFDTWYSMIQPQLLAPEMSSQNPEDIELEKYEIAFEERMLGCSGFHRSLSDKFHSTTTLLYSNNEENKSFDRCVWEGDGKPEDGKRDEWLVSRHENHARFFGDGTVKLYGPEEKERHDKAFDEWMKEAPYQHYPPPPPVANTVAFALMPETAPGDGTVHAGAGDFPTSSGGLKRLPVEAREEHQGFFNCPDVRGQLLSELQSVLPDIHAKLGG